VTCVADGADVDWVFDTLRANTRGFASPIDRNAVARTITHTSTVHISATFFVMFCSTKAVFRDYKSKM